MSQVRKARKLPTWAESQTVGPHVYMETLGGEIGMRGVLVRVSELQRWSCFGCFDGCGCGDDVVDDCSAAEEDGRFGEHLFDEMKDVVVAQDDNDGDSNVRDDDVRRTASTSAVSDE